jgi:hypothetical protein
MERVGAGLKGGRVQCRAKRQEFSDMFSYEHNDNGGATYALVVAMAHLDITTAGEWPNISDGTATQCIMTKPS